MTENQSQPEQDTPTGDELRSTNRMFLKYTAICHRGDEGLGEMVASQIVNISSTGAQLLMRQQFEMDEQFYLAVSTPRRELILDVMCTTKWIKKEGEGSLRIGVEFTRTITDEEIQILHNG